jgi:hypothetical protein
VAYRRLPVVPDLDHLKNQAKRLLSALRDGETAAGADFTAFHPDVPSASAAKLTDAQLVLARSYRQPSFARLLTTARIQRALHSNDVDALQAIAADDPESLQAFSTIQHGQGRPREFSEARRVSRSNVFAFLRAHAPDLSVDDLKLINGGQHGGGLVLRYGNDQVVKVPKNGTRKGLLKEAAILEYIRRQDLPITVPEPLEVHEKGFFAVYRMPEGDGQALTPAVLARLSDADLEVAIRSIAQFFHVLHTHRFPNSVLQHVPEAHDGYDVAPARMRRKIQFIREHSSDYDTDRWEENLDRLEPSLIQVLALAQCDPQTGFFEAIDGNLTRLSMGSFYDATRHDPAIDIHDFMLEVQSDLEDEDRIRQICDWLVEHYTSDDPNLAAKIEYGLMGHEVRWAHIRVRRQVRKLDRSNDGVR